jgi:FkbM family methyltransferase
MMPLATRHKIALATLVRSMAMIVRRLVGRGTKASVTRRGMSWHLDLDEGIDFAIWLFGQFEAETAKACAGLVSSGSVVVDIGANMGAHSLPLARTVGPAGQVIAIEPTWSAFDRLTKNCEANPQFLERLILVQAMLAGSAGQALESEIYSSWPLKPQMTASLHPLHRGAAKPTTGARVATLDSLIEELGVTRIDLIKLDVDGAEIDVLEGGRETLARFRPPIVMELAPYVMTERGFEEDALVTLLHNRGYMFCDLAGRSIDREIAAIAKGLGPGQSINVLALPLQ